MTTISLALFARQASAGEVAGLTGGETRTAILSERG
jgi:hypothetical protein